MGRMLGPKMEKLTFSVLSKDTVTRCHIGSSLQDRGSSICMSFIRLDNG